MVNGTITKRLEEVLNNLNDEYKTLCNSFYIRMDFKNKIKSLKECEYDSQKPSILSSLFHMFEMAGIDYQKDKNIAYYENLINSANLPDAIDIEKRIVDVLYKNFDKYPTPQEYMLRLVNNLSNPKDDWISDTLRLRILKQFIKYGDYLKDAHFGGQKEINRYINERVGKKKSKEEICRYLDDKIFEKLKEATKPQKKPEGKVGLLKLADDLAAGKFRTGGAAKRGLYLFAMVYGMTFRKDDCATDIEKNLFRDYYSNNLMRFLTEEYRDVASDFEMAPSGQGINFKNFAEMIYLYFIVSDHNTVDKIKFSTQMIEEVQIEFERNPFNNSNHDTNFFRSNYDSIFTKSSSQFKKYLLENYNCSTHVVDPKTGKSYDIGIMQSQIEQNTAKRVHQELLKELEHLIDINDCDYGLCLMYIEKMKNYHIKDDKKFNDFCKILNYIHKLLKNKRNFDGSHIDRTAIIVIYYYYHNEYYNKNISGYWKNFEEHFNNFRDGVNLWLEEALYQPLDFKNIFDIAVVFSSYVYLNL